MMANIYASTDDGASPSSATIIAQVVFVASRVISSARCFRSLRCPCQATSLIMWSVTKWRCSVLIQFFLLYTLFLFLCRAVNYRTKCSTLPHQMRHTTAKFDDDHSLSVHKSSLADCSGLLSLHKSILSGPQNDPRKRGAQVFLCSGCAEATDFSAVSEARGGGVRAF